MPTGTYTPFDKPSRHRSRLDYEAARLPWCELCGQVATAGRRIVPHHVKTRGAGGGDEEKNLLSLCETADGQGCHQLVHAGRIPAEKIQQALANREQAP